MYMHACTRTKYAKIPSWRQKKQIERTRGLRCYFAPISAVLSSWNLATGECTLGGVWCALIRTSSVSPTYSSSGGSSEVDSDVEDAIYAHMYFEEFPGVHEISGEVN